MLTCFADALNVSDHMQHETRQGRGKSAVCGCRQWRWNSAAPAPHPPTARVTRGDTGGWFCDLTTHQHDQSWATRATYHQACPGTGWYDHGRRGHRRGGGRGCTARTTAPCRTEACETHLNLVADIDDTIYTCALNLTVPHTRALDFTTPHTHPYCF